MISLKNCQGGEISPKVAQKVTSTNLVSATTERYFLTTLLATSRRYQQWLDRTSISLRSSSAEKTIHYFYFPSLSVWPDVEIKSSPSFSKSSLTYWLKNQCFSQLPKKSPNICATFVAKFVAKKFLKSPNLVTLLLNTKACRYGIYYIISKVFQCFAYFVISNDR